MERRTFIKNATALTALPALPSAAFGAAPISATLLARAEHMAGLWVHSSARMMQNAFKLDDQTAQALFQVLRDRNIVAAPNAYGVARAILPCYDNPVFAAKVNRLLAKVTPKVSSTTQATHHEIKEMAQKLKSEFEKRLTTDITDQTQEDIK